MCEDSSDKRLGPLCQRFCGFLSQPLKASVLTSASSRLKSLLGLRAALRIAGPVDARKSRSDPRAPQRIEDCAGEDAPQPKSE